MDLVAGSNFSSYLGGASLDGFANLPSREAELPTFQTSSNQSSAGLARRVSAVCCSFETQPLSYSKNRLLRAQAEVRKAAKCLYDVSVKLPPSLLHAQPAHGEAQAHSLAGAWNFGQKKLPASVCRLLHSNVTLPRTFIEFHTGLKQTGNEPPDQLKSYLHLVFF